MKMIRSHDPGYERISLFSRYRPFQKDVPLVWVGSQSVGVSGKLTEPRGCLLDFDRDVPEHDVGVSFTIRVISQFDSQRVFNNSGVVACPSCIEKDIVYEASHARRRRCSTKSFNYRLECALLGRKRGRFLKSSDEIIFRRHLRSPFSVIAIAITITHE